MTNPIEICSHSDLPVNVCEHCGAQPGTRIQLTPVRRPRRGHPVSTDLPTPPTYPTRKLGKSKAGECACGQPTRDGAYGCDDCADELSRLYGDVPWLAEQLDTTITRQRGKRPGASARANDGLPWDLKAATTQKALLQYLQGVAVTCIKSQIRHQSPNPGGPANTPNSISAWLLWRVDGLQFNEAFPDALKRGLAIEQRIYGCIDRGPDLLYLGVCQKVPDGDTEPCGGAIYAKTDETIGSCRVCRAKYDTNTTRTELAAKLDDMLCTAAEIAHLATYLGLDVERRRIQLVVAQWHKRKRIAAAPSSGPDAAPRFRYGDVAILLAQTYAKPA